jgi:alpha-1,2-glucosyltransferase
MSLVTAPLVEPRYFIIPWLLWRLSVPEYVPPSEAQGRFAELDFANSQRESTQMITKYRVLLRVLAKYSVYLEFGWYMLVNLVTCYIFLYKGFEWPQEPGNVQRFMW